jgi:hypothetical protein
MLGVFIKVLASEHGFTASECGIIAALATIFLERLLTTF